MNETQDESGAGEDVVILVDDEDRRIGQAEKATCHRHPVPLHRAFSVFLFDAAGRTLLTKRSAAKATWPGFWSNACCSHPRPGEGTAEAAARRVREELGVEADLRSLFSFLYEARYDATWGEHELDHVFIGRLEGELAPDPAEIEDWRLVGAEALRTSLAVAPDACAPRPGSPRPYTPWFRLSAARVLDEARALGLLDGGA